jgi:hypothetical protein
MLHCIAREDLLFWNGYAADEFRDGGLFFFLVQIDPTGGVGSETGGGIADAGRRRGGGNNVMGCMLWLSTLCGVDALRAEIKDHLISGMIIF